jgi:purine catabolism regulator
MSPTVRDLLAQPGLGLTVLAGEHRLDDELRWAATSEHLDPTPFLQGGELLLTTGIPLPRTAPAVQAYADRLAAAGVVGIGLGVELVHDTVPPRLVRAAERAGLVLLEVDAPTSFVSVGKALSDLLTKEQYGETLRIAQAQQDLTRAAVREGPAGVVRTTARLIGGWAVTVDADRSVQYAHPPQARRRARMLDVELERLSTSGPSAASVVEDDEHVSLHTLTATRRMRGFFLAGSPRQPTAVDRAVLGVATALLSFAQLHPREQERERSAALLRLATSGTVTDGRLLAALGGPLFRRDTLRVLAAAGPPTDVEELAAYLADEPARHAIASLEGAEVLAVLAAERLEAVLDQIRTRPALRAGLSEPVAPAALADGAAQARRARDLATSRGVPVLDYAEAMSGAVATADPTDATAYARRLLAPLQEYGARTGVDLPKTLRVWLRHHGLFDPAATELGVHRHTLRHRVRRAEQLLDRPLDDADTRMDLWFALKVLHSGQR